MSYAMLAVIGNIVCWRTGDWKNWQRCYPTILYAYIGNLVYDALISTKPLWAFGMLAYRYPILDLLIMALVYPPIVILYLSHYPPGPGRQVLYTLMWTAISCAAEAIALFTNGLLYFNGWTIYYTVLFNLAMFPLFRLHSRRPMLAWPISAALAALLIWWFRIPLAR